MHLTTGYSCCTGAIIYDPDLINFFTGKLDSIKKRSSADYCSTMLIIMKNRYS
jgi:hypothetical protein